MKQKLLILALLVNGGLFAQSIPDGGFETWSVYTWQDPQYYNTSNQAGNHSSTVGSSTIPPANVTQTTGKYGSFGVQIQNILFHTDTVPGYIIEANTGGGGGGPTGGIPYAQKPTGVRFWYKYTTTGVDTAAILVMFKKSGVIIDSFFVAIPSSASTSTYTLHSYYPVHPIPVTPDTVIFAAAASKAVVNQHNNFNKGIIPGSTLTIDSVTFTGVGALQPAELNGNFENWITDTINIPIGWFISYPGTTITTDHYAGTHALQVETVNSPSNGITNGQANTGYWPNNCYSNCYEQGGYAYTTQVDTLTFWYKYSPKPNDTAQVWLNFIKNGQGIYGTSINFYTSVTSWTYASFPFNVGQSPDTVVVNITSSAHNHDTSQAQYAPYVGSTFKIDNLQFKSQPLGIAPVMEQSGEITIYPSPAKETLNIDFTNQSIRGAVTISIIDMLGREVIQSEQNVNTTILPIDISGLTSGVYLIKVMNGSNYTIARFIKN